MIRRLSGLALSSLLGSILVLVVACSNNPVPPASSPAPAPPPTSAPVPPITPTLVPPPTPTITPPTPLLEASGTSGWKLIFQDEFDGPKLDPDKWANQLQWGRTNSPELQYYSPDALEVKDGILRIKAEKHGTDYTSGVVATFWHFWFTYGYAEIRARVPSGTGLWPAFWLLAKDSKSANEIDVLEIRGQEPDVLHATLHYGPNPADDIINTDFRGPDFSQDFHTFAVKWEPSSIVWYVDEKEVFRVTERVPRESMYLIANLAVGGSWPGSPDANTPFPAHMDIDYVRVYQNQN